MVVVLVCEWCAPVIVTVVVLVVTVVVLIVVLIVVLLSHRRPRPKMCCADRVRVGRCIWTLSI